MSKYLVEYVYTNKKYGCCVSRFYLPDIGFTYIVNAVDAQLNYPILLPGIHKWTIYDIEDNAAAYVTIKEVE